MRSLTKARNTHVEATVSYADGMNSFQNPAMPIEFLARLPHNFMTIFESMQLKTLLGSNYPPSYGERYSRRTIRVGEQAEIVAFSQAYHPSQ